MKVDWLIIGAGFTGATLAERIASQLGQKVLVVDRRAHIGGNAFDEYRGDLLVHRYGPHIFHTNSDKVWRYLSQFTEWRPYYHRVLAMVEGHAVAVPFNLNSLHRLFPAKMAERTEHALVEEYGHGARVPILRMRESANADIRALADYVYRNVFEGYNRKQWELTPEQLDPSVSARVPVHVSRDDRYFQDTYQAIPSEGYTKLFERMLSHRNISLLLNVEAQDAIEGIKFRRMVYSGAVDEFFGYEFGRLPYRSLRFETKIVEQEQVQAVAQINYPNEFDFTRIVEQKHLTGQSCPRSALVTEYPCPHVPGVNDPYYPIPSAASRAVYDQYRPRIEKLGSSVIFAGRLADYQYYNMDQAVGRALSVFEKQVAVRDGSHGQIVAAA